MSASRMAAIAVLLSLCAATSAAAQTYRSGDLRISHAWSRPTPPGAPTAAGYLTIQDKGGVADRLTGGSSPDAAAVEVHQMSMTGGIMRMRPVEGGLAVPAGGTVTLAPGGYHLMLIGPKRPFKIGDRIPVTLAFARAGRVPIRLVVEPPSGGMAMGSMKMGRP